MYTYVVVMLEKQCPSPSAACDITTTTNSLSIVFNSLKNSYGIYYNGGDKHSPQ